MLIIILFIAVILRFSPNLYLTGGQDQGSYVSMSKQYEINHSLYINDDLREKLSTENKYWYDLGNNLLGVKIKNLDESQYVFPFYPVFPSWMSIFGDIFGSDNRTFALSFLSLVSIVGMYLLAYEISGKDRNTGLLAAFFLAINPLHNYFSRIPVTEIVYLMFFLLFAYYLVRFFKEKKRQPVFLVLSLLSAAASFLTRMNGAFLLPIIILIPILSVVKMKDNQKLRDLVIFSISWITLFFLSFVYYSEYLPRLYNLIVGKRLTNFVNPWLILFSTVAFVFATVFALWDKKGRKFIAQVINWFQGKIWWIVISVFFLLIGYELFFYVKKIFIESSNSLFSFDSLSLLKQQSFLVTFLYLSPVGFALIPVSLWFFRKKKDVCVKLMYLSLSIFLVYCWGILRLSQYHYYYARYQLSELIPVCIIVISMFLVSISKSKKGRIITGILILMMSVYLGFFSVLQTMEKEGADVDSYEYLEDIVGENDILFATKYKFDSFDQVVLPIRYYYDLNFFPLYYQSYIQKEEIIDLKNEYDEAYILTTIPGLNRQFRGEFEFVREIHFGHSYFTHCLRDEDSFFEMESHSFNIPLCEYIIIPNRFYRGVYKAYLYRWE
jgi:4-amino-4-deoxy-L-arabinose transferase-like glycosyltransferase